MSVREFELDRWMARLASGDREAFPPLYAALHPRAFRLAQHRIRNGDAQDVAQAALMRVFARASEFVPGKACLPWFYAIVANEIRATQRRAARLVLDDAAADATVADTADPEAQLFERELERALELAVDDLDVDAAQAIWAMLERGPAPDVSPATFRKRVSRAYAKLRLVLGGHDVG